MKVKNEEIDLLPLDQFHGKVLVVDSPDKFAEAIAQLRQQSLLGFDTETRPTFTRGVSHRVALLQLSTDSTTWLFRLNIIGLPPELADIMSDDKITKVGLAIRDDLKALRRRRDFTPRGCFDVQTMASAEGIEDLGLKKLAARVLGVRISKRQRLTNWENPTLTAQQIDYAATDSWVSLLMYLAIKDGKTLHPRYIEAQKEVASIQS